MKIRKKTFYGTVMLALAAVLFGGCSGESGGEALEEHFSASVEEVASINLSVKDREIEILPSSDGKIHITYFKNEKEFYQIGVDESQVLTMKSESDKELSDFFGLSGDSMKSIKLELPNPLPCNLVISTTKNGIKVPEISVMGNMDIQINDGGIELDRTSVQGDVTLSAKNGDVSGTIGGSYEEYIIQSKAHKGDNNLPENKADGIKALNVNTNNGDIELEFSGNK